MDGSKALHTTDAGATWSPQTTVMGNAPYAAECLGADLCRAVGDVGAILVHQALGVVGARCLPDGACGIKTSPGCASEEGGYLGDATECDPNPCEQPGACCNSDNMCHLTPESECEASGGTYFGGPCDPDPCQALDMRDPEAWPTEFVVEAPSPNPTRSGLSLQMRLPAPGRVQVALFDVSGKLLATLADGILPGGQHQMSWRQLDVGGMVLASGIDYLRVQGAEARKTAFVVVER